MITSFFLKGLVAVLLFIASPITNLPDAALDPSYAIGAATAVADVKAIALIAPLTFYALMGGLAALVGFEFVFAGYKVIMWGIRKIPFIN